MKHRLKAAAVLAVVVGLLCGAGAPAARADASLTTSLELTGRDADHPENQVHVQRGGTVEWVASYEGAADVVSDVRIDQAFSAGQKIVAGSVEVPDGWTTSTSADGGKTYGSDAPGSATTNVRAEGILAPGGRGKVAALPKPAEMLATGGATRGDGWVPILYKNFSFNVYHHKQPGPSGHIMCVDRSTGLACPGYPARISSVPGPAGSGPDDMATVGQPNVYIDVSGRYGTSGDMYFPVQRDNDMGVSCFNLNLRTNCGYHRLGDLKRQPASGVPQMWDGIETYDGRLYGLGGDGRMYCYDLGAAGPCAGQPFATGMAVFDPAMHKDQSTGNPSGIGEQHALIGGRVYSVINYTTQIAGISTVGSVLNCFDPATNAVCAGWSANPRVPGTVASILNPLAPVGTVTSVFEWANPAGATKGVCAAGVNVLGARIATCYSPAGEMLSDPSAPPGLFDGLPPNFTPMRQLQSGNRMYLATLLANTPSAGATGMGICYDWSVQAQCEGFSSPQSWEGVNGANTRDYGYTDDGSCLWGLGDTGFLWSFDRETGTNPCTRVGSTVEIEPSTQFYCDGASGHARGWSTAAVTGLELNDVSALLVNVTDESGAPVPGFEHRDLAAEHTLSLDLSTIDLAEHPRLKVAVEAYARSDTAWTRGTPRLVVGFDGDPVQVCTRTVVVDDCSVGDVRDVATSFTHVDGISGTDALEARKTMNVFRPGESCGVDVAAQKDDKRLRATPGDRLTYEIVVTNNTGIAVTGVRVVDTVPANTTFESATDGGSKADGKVTWPAFDLAPGGRRTLGVVTLVGTDAKELTVRNLVNAVDDGTHGPDTVPANNDAWDDTSVSPSTADSTTDPSDPPADGGSGGGGSGSQNPGGSTQSSLPFTGGNLSMLVQAAAMAFVLGITFVRGSSGRAASKPRNGPGRSQGSAGDGADLPPFPEAASPEGSRRGGEPRYRRPF